MITGLRFDISSGSDHDDDDDDDACELRIISSALNAISNDELHSEGKEMQ